MHKPHNQDPLYVTHFTLIIRAELATPALRRDALRYLCLLLPQANRDTLQELLRFLTRVALRSNGIILIDGTEVCVCVCVRVCVCVCVCMYMSTHHHPPSGECVGSMVFTV